MNALRLAACLSLFATPALAGLASIPLGSAQTSPCDGIDGAQLATGDANLLLEVEGARTANADGSVRFTQARAELTRIADGQVSSICLDVRAAGAIVVDTAPDGDLRLTQKKSGADVFTVRAGPLRTTVTPVDAPFAKLVLPLAGGFTLEPQAATSELPSMVLDPDSTFALGRAGMVLDPDSTIALDTHAVFRHTVPGPHVVTAMLPAGASAPLVFRLVARTPVAAFAVMSIDGAGGPAGYRGSWVE